MKCPIDNTELRISERNGIEIDYCPVCRGIWLDRGELDKLIERALKDEQQRYSVRVETSPDYVEKHKNDYDYDLDDRFDDNRYETRNSTSYDRSSDNSQHRRKKRSLLEDIFDIFD